jgi:tetratricopeptide (TPR) repeat protein
MAASLSAGFHEFAAGSRPGGAAPCKEEAMILRLPKAASAVLLSLSLASPAALADEPQTAATHLLAALYGRGQERLARGEIAVALPVFRTVLEVAPELPEAHGALALATMMGGFGRRAEAQPMLARAVAGDPDNPIYAALGILADPRRAELRADRALYLSPGAAEEWRAAVARLPGYAPAREGKRAASALGATEASGDARFPRRLRGFADLLGGRLAALLALNVPAARFDAYEPRLVARLQGDVATLDRSNGRLREVRSRLEALRSNPLPRVTPGR